ncbi:MAG: phospho-N-acetylmuramoyl-pentapeptide-transferase [Proteobacteria bacterium]|nr:MAG: phospho-N-acetylmuramoyl-pentapeptide-transferase [Pseudomonadota bacterium]PIE17894.1 MAG: phospho-N-acetylmuramoyl-pentapeptide-transferase [Pseudomonadota bacterium]
MLFHLLYPLSRYTALRWLNVVRYPSSRIIASTLTAMLMSFLLGPWFIRQLKSRQIGQVVRDDGPTSHLSKAGTPTMGGALIILCLVIPSLLWSDLYNQLVWLTLSVTVAYAAIGFLDDSLKLRLKNSKGLPGKLKMLGQIVSAAVALGFVFYGKVFQEQVRYRLALPFLNFDRHPVRLPHWLYFGLSLIVVVGSSNAVNLTDGLDGLAIGPVIISAGTFLFLSYAAGTVLGKNKFNIAHYLNIPHIQGASELAVYCGAMVGSGVGFLWYNTYPASVFMGDVGSLSLGGGLGMLAVLTKNESVWAVLGGIFVLEAVSVIIQVISFKLTGKRVFRMAPIHHHFEKKGWAEPKVIVRFWIISIMLALIALATLKLR